MPEWFLGAREGGAEVLLSRTLHKTEVADTSGAVIVETRRLVAREEKDMEDVSRGPVWETTICPCDASDPDGPEALVFAVCHSLEEAYVGHEQAVTFSAAALGSTTRRGGTA